MDNEELLGVETTNEVTPPFFFDGFAVREVVYRTLEREPCAPDEKRPERLVVKYHVSGRLQFSASGKEALITMRISVRPDPKWQPYDVEATIVGKFRTGTSEAGEFLQFCQLGAPAILFPYIRQRIHSVTTDGEHGALLIDPMNTQALFANNWMDEEPTAAEAPSPETPKG